VAKIKRRNSTLVCTDDGGSQRGKKSQTAVEITINPESETSPFGNPVDVHR
jgi:hypothetical protein